MAMTIVNDNGETPHAWLDAALLHDACAGYRCRLSVGDAGGIVCDMVVGNGSLDAAGVARIATAAVVNTDPLDTAPLPIEDQNGTPARILPDADHVVEVSALARHRDPPEVREDIEVTVALPLIPMVAMVVVLVAGIVMVGLDVPMIGTLNIILGGIGLVSIVRSSVAAGGSAGMDVHSKVVMAAKRERERRERLPGAVSAG